MYFSNSNCMNKGYLAQRQSAPDLFQWIGINLFHPRDLGGCCKPRHIFPWGVPGPSQRQTHKGKAVLFQIPYSWVLFGLCSKASSIGGRKSQLQLRFVSMLQTQATLEQTSQQRVSPDACLTCPSMTYTLLPTTPPNRAVFMN